MPGLALKLGDALEEVLGNTYSIRSSRSVSDGLMETPEPGFLDIITNAALGSPETRPALRPGRPAALAWDATPLGSWRIDKATLDYGYGDKADPEAYRLQITGRDNTPTLAATPGPDTTISGNLTQRVNHILAGTGIAYAVHDNSPTETIRVLARVPADETPEPVITQLSRAVATKRGWMHLDAAGVLQIYDASTRTRSTGYQPVVTLTDVTTAGSDVAYYTDITPRFDSADAVNILTFTNTTTDAKVVRKDAASIAQWGPAPAELEVTDGNHEIRSRIIFAIRATPRTFPDTITLKVGEGHTDPALVAALELHDAVTVTRQGLPTMTLIITGIEHTISATKTAKDNHVRWFTTLTLRQPEAIPLTWNDVPNTLTWNDVPNTLEWQDAATWTP